MRIEQISGNIGAEISDIDLASVTDDEVEEIKKAWLDHKVLVYRNQHITVEEHKPSVANSVSLRYTRSPAAAT